MASKQPELPEAAHADLDSMLSRKFGREVANYFSGSPVNRVSFLRSDSQFLTQAFTHPSTRFLLFKDLAPLGPNLNTLSYLKRNEIATLIPSNPWSKSEKEIMEEYNSNITIPQMVFLGLDERTQKAETERTSDEGKDGGFKWKEVYKGAPLFAVDVTPKGSIKEKCEELIQEVTEKQGLEFLQGNRNMILSFPAAEAAIYGQARALIDWNARNPFCGGCGQPTLSINAGGKRTCPPTDLARLVGAVGATSGEAPVSTSERPPCATRKGVSNLCFPRTDPTIIVAVISHDGQRIMLGRQRRWPPNWYSTLAGFVEPAESIEEAVRREVWEESGVSLGRVVIHSTQPWPFPANLMIGAIGQAVPGDGEKIDLGNDPELEDARWFSFEEVREALKTGTSGIGEPPLPGYKEGSLRLPPRTAIANQLVEALVDGFVSKSSML